MTDHTDHTDNTDQSDDIEDEVLDADTDDTLEDALDAEASDERGPDDDSDDDSGDGSEGGGDDSEGDGSQGDDDASEDGDGDDASDGDDGGSSGSGRRRRRGRRGGRGRGSGGGGGNGKQGGSSDNGSGDGSKSGDGSSSGGDKRDAATRKAIEQGGTRSAARKGGSGGGGRGHRGGRGRPPSPVPDDVRRAILDGPPKTMLVSSRDDRTQIVVMEERTAVEHHVHRAEDVSHVGNVYLARVQNVLPGMEAAFLDIGRGRNGVLYAGEVNYDEFDVEEGSPRIEDVLKPGAHVLVQVTKDAMGTKGPRLTMELSFAGRYMVLSPNSDIFGISRKLSDKERDRLRRIVKKVRPKHHGLIVRTAAAEASDEAIEADLRRLLARWEAIEGRAKDAKPLSAVYEEPPLVVKVIRDTFGSDFDRLVVDDEELHGRVHDYLEEVAPDLLAKVHLWQPPEDGERDLFAAYEVTEQLRKATERKVWLPSGGYLIIETTEAMKVIDVNTGKFTGKKGTSLEEVVFKTNVEAAREIVRQLRLRDLGGIIVVDFIDMLLKANQDEVIRTLERELLRDRTKTRVSDVSRLGLVQITRKNVSAGLVETFSTTCDHCHGRGFTVHLD